MRDTVAEQVMAREMERLFGAKPNMMVARGNLLARARTPVVEVPGFKVWFESSFHGSDSTYSLQAVEFPAAGVWPYVGVGTSVNQAATDLVRKLSESQFSPAGRDAATGVADYLKVRIAEGSKQ